MAPKIFISYRRDDAPGSAGRLYDRLSETFSADQIFIDVDAISPGVDFVLALDGALKDCDVLLAIIGKNWTNAKDSEGIRRLESDGDFVRTEIATALEQDIRVIPVLVDGAEMPSAEDLPDILKPLTRRNAVELSHSRFVNDTDRLARALALPAGEAREAAAGNGISRDLPARETAPPDTTAGQQAHPTPAGRSIGGWLDSFFRHQSPMTIWGLPLAAGALIIWSSSFFGIDSVHAPPVDVAQGTFGTCSSSGKQVGLWTSLNWSAVYLVLFPIFLILISFLSRYMRRMIDECIENGVLISDDGGKPDRRAVHLGLDRELASNNKLFLSLIFVVIVISLSGWWTSSGLPLLNFHIGSTVVSWATVVIACGQRDLQFYLFGYTLVAYIWMGLALFVYIACLFLGFIYASFLSRLAFSGGQAEGKRQTYRLIFRHRVFPRYLHDVFFAYFIACSFGLLAGYFMRLQAGYLFTGYESLGGYWFQDLQWLMQKLNLSTVTSAPHQSFQLDAAKHQTIITGLFVSGITLVSFLGTGWMVYGAFQNAKEFVLAARTKPEGSAVAQIRDMTADETRRIEETSFLPAVVPAVGTMVVVMSVFLLGTVYSGTGFLVLSVTMAVLLKSGIQRGLRTWRAPGGQGS